MAYAPAYTGTKDHDYVDIIAAWFTKDNVSTQDNVSFVLKTLDGTRLMDAVDWDIQCDVQVRIFLGDELQGRLGLHLTKRPGQRHIVSSAEWRQDDGQGVPVRHGFTAGLETPGFFQFTMGRQALLSFGSRTGAFDAGCFEVYAPVGAAAAANLMNSDVGQSTRPYWFPNSSSLSPNPPENGSTSTATESSRSPGPERTPGVGLFWTVTAALAVIWPRARRRAPSRDCREQGDACGSVGSQSACPPP